MTFEVTEQDIRDAVAARHEKTIRLVQDLIRTPSVNPWFGEAPEISGEAAVQDLLETTMRELGVDDVDRWEPSAADLAHRADGPGYYPDRDFTGRPNLVGRWRGTDPDAPAVMVQGHADVVGIGSGWTADPFGGERRDGKVVGRGAVDMKGGFGAALSGFAALRDLGVQLRQDVIFASVVDEEAGGMGTLALVDRGHTAPGGVIVPEATRLQVAPLCRGILWAEVTFYGRAGHIELEQHDWRRGDAVDAIAYGHKFLDAVRELNARWAQDPRKSHPLLPLPCEIRVSSITAGESPTTYAPSFTVGLNIQYLPAEKDEHGLGGKVKAEIEELVASIGVDDEWFAANPPKITWIVDADCGETPSDAPIVTTTLEAVQSLGVPTRVEGVLCHTDMGLMIDSGSPTITFGPGDLRVAHQPDEHVHEDELLAMAQAVALTLFRLSQAERR